ncbi:MAG: hypothetical protein K5643_07490 [Saccharofermentans sp.]|nr:hypothetical protein [Saccharofermentans sp.]
MRLNSDEIFVLTIGFIVLAYAVTSTVLFIVDGVKAKRRGRRRKVAPIVMFITGMVLFAAAAGIVLFLYLLMYAIMTSM